MAVILAMLMVLTIIPWAEAKTQEEIWNQRLISQIGYSNTRLKSFCSDSNRVVESYERKVCKSGECTNFLKNRWNELCKYRIDGNVVNYDYQFIFDNMKNYMREHRLPLLKHRSEIVAVVEPVVEDTLVISEQPVSIGGGSNRNRRMIQ